MHKKKTITFIATAIVGITAVASAAFTPSAWQYIRPIDTAGNSGMIKVHIPENVSWNANGFSDLRIIDGQGNEVPYILSRNISSSGNESDTRLLDMTQTQAGATQFIVDFGSSGIVHTGLHIVTSSPNFRRQVVVYSSDSLLPIDDSKWSLVTNEGFIFKFTDPYTGQVAGKDTITFPANAARYLKVFIGSNPGEGGAVAVNSVTAYRDVRISTASYSRTLTASVYKNPVKKTSELTIDLGASGLVTSSIAIDSPDTNYSRRVIVEVSDTAATSSWVYVGESSISQISTSMFHGVSNIVQYPEQKSRFIRLSVINDDNPALSLSQTVGISGPVLAAIFEAHPGVSYALYYGNPSARQPEYDITRLSTYIDEASLPVVTAGSESPNPLYVAPQGPVVPFTESHKILLNILLVIVVLGIGVGIVVYLRSYLKKGSVPTDNSFEK